MKASEISSPLLDKLSPLQLEGNALELEVNGYTVVEDALDPDMRRKKFKTSYAKRSFKHAGLYTAAK